MSANISTILVIGATSGIGQAFTKHFHSKGKKIIAAGRRLDRLSALKSTHAGLETIQLDIEDITNLDTNLQHILTTYPSLDSVFIAAGKMDLCDFKDPSTTQTKNIASEITTNLTATISIAHTMIPHFISLKKPTTLITVSSGLAFIPVPYFPVYCATKAGIHSFSVTLRTQLADTNVNVLEVAPPYVATELDTKFKERYIEAQGGADKARVPISLEEYMAEVTGEFEKEGAKEVAVGFAKLGADAWRGTFGPILQNFGMKG
ncbi:hypothetical protein G7Y89_g1677 [Cudoniella acicularis]|uniref:NAD(P)-binding protein n=1 Tax=Cudoniella acicularis TaxID=354080 RepID=A0A8H4RUU3_9HELO|nr:hypothetical protein G7Y89_g1677 [Cudoniella acicularis]